MNNLAERIRKILRDRPYWGPQTVARAAGTTPQTVRVVASREKIAFMDRYQAEAYTDRLVEAIEKLEASGGQTQ